MLIPSILFRLARILAAYRRRAEVVGPPPLRLWVESASCCNLKCPMCPNRTMAPADKGVMAMDLFRSLIAQARGKVNDMYLHHRGEPLLNPRLPDMIRLAREAGIRTRFHSNGALWTDARAAAILDAGPDLVSFSVDGYDKRTYEAIRVGADFAETVDNILRLARQRRARRLRRPYLVVEQIRFASADVPSDPDRAAAFRRSFLEAGVDEVIEKEEYVWAGDAAPPRGERTCLTCTFPWYAMVICHDGTVTPCPQDFWAKLRMGSLAEKPLLEIWNDTPYRELRRTFGRAETLRPICADCDRLRRKTVGGVPLQYAATFLIDQTIGYGPLRRRLGTRERN